MKATIFLILHLCIYCYSIGQTITRDTIEDGSFEVQPTNPSSQVFTAPWFKCVSRNTPDWQPNKFGVTLPPYHGNYYLGLITKPAPSSSINPIIKENIAQRIVKFLGDGDQYFMVMYLASSATYGPNGYNPEGKLNLKFRKDSHCNTDTSQIIWQSPVIDQNHWELQVGNFTFSTGGWLIFEAENTPNYAAHCNILVDSVAGPFPGQWPFPSLGDDQYLCEGDSATFSLPQPGTNLIPDTVNYLWSDGSRDLTRTFNETGVYSVCSIWNKLKQCDTVFIHVETQPEFTIDESGLSCLGDAVSLKATVGRYGYEYIWSDGTIDSMITVSESSALYVSASNGICSAVDSTTVSFRDCSATLEMPNVFSPNGDGINDVFRPMNAINIYSIQIDIFDRWGRKVAVLRSLDQGWDGTNSLGQTLPEGVYFWAARYQGVEDEEVVVVKGNVTLVR